MSEKVYKEAAAAQQAAGAGAGPDMGGAAGAGSTQKPDDDVIDGDFKEV